ncbi:MAG TPA: O-antigen ligase domain-containing protein, partial [Allosphingosinicella sp.]
MKIERLRGWAGPIFLAACLILGGASGRGAGAVGNAALQLAAVAVIVLSLWTRRDSVYPVQAKQLTWIVAGFVLIVALSLIPLPASLWPSLPGREPIAAGYPLLGMDLPALPLSLSAQQTLASLMWVLPPIAMFLLVLQASPRRRRRMLWVALIVAVFSIGLGAAQLLGGEGSGLRFYQITNRTQPVGFFANANHQATLLLCALPLTGYLAARALSRGKKAQRSAGLIVSSAIALFLLVGIGIIGSLAGYGLALPAVLATLLIYRRASSGRLGGKELGGFAAVFALFIGLA